MSGVPAVIVKKGGFLSSLFTGLFGFLIAVVVCASGLGFYGLHLVDKMAGGLFGVTGDVIAGLPQWQQNLPPLLAESLDDRRAPDYREKIDLTVKSITTAELKNDLTTLVVVTNRGSETVTLLAMNITLENAEGIPFSERRVYAATPITLDDDDWRGPLMPSETRKFLVRHCRDAREGEKTNLQASVSIADLRVWNGPSAKRDAETITAAVVADRD